MPNDDNVHSFAREAFRAKLQKLAEGKNIDDAVFADIIYTAISQFGLAEDKFRDAFGLSLGAVERWSLMQSLPQPLVRAKILLWVRENI